MLLSRALRLALFFSIFMSFVGVASAQYAGRYSDGRTFAVYFEDTKYGLTIRPLLWTATQLLTPVGQDKFAVIDRRSREVDFLRNGDGKISAVVIRGMDGEGLTLRRTDYPRLALEEFLAGRFAEGAKKYGADTSRLIADAGEVLLRLPTKARAVIGLLEISRFRVGQNAAYEKLLGLAYVRVGERRKALSHFRRSHQLDPKDAEVISALARLGVRTSDGPYQGWTVPFPLSSVFRTPTKLEIAAVEADWAARDLSVKDVREEYRGPVSIRDWQATLRVVSHLVHGKRHYGAIITPNDPTGSPLAVLIDVKGVSPTYFALDIQRIETPAMMGDSANKFVYVVPSLRGEVLVVGEKQYKSEGDRRDALDGATDDTLAFLNAALATTPEADRERICAFGRSRGGNVVLLAGIRDPRIKCVVNVSGPTDWFNLMGTEGWTEQELWTEGMRLRSSPTQVGGQNLERFLGRAINGEVGLDEVRHNMIASSPLYFASRLPLSVNHYGLEDPFVPSRNGYRLERAARRARRTEKFYFYRNEGHDTDRLAQPEISRTFILNALKVK